MTYLQRAKAGNFPEYDGVMHALAGVEAHALRRVRIAVDALIDRIDKDAQEAEAAPAKVAPLAGEEELEEIEEYDQ